MEENRSGMETEMLLEKSRAVVLKMGCTNIPGEIVKNVNSQARRGGWCL